jgi:hypothetical protein
MLTDRMMRRLYSIGAVLATAVLVSAGLLFLAAYVR